MTPEQKYDRLERIVRLICKDALRASRESRKQNAKLRDYVRAQREYEVAKQELAVKPDGAETKDALNRAREVLDQAREELKHSTENEPARLPCMM